MVERDALTVALDMFRSPSLARKVQQQELPSGILRIIRIAAGEKFDDKIAEDAHGWSEADIRAAAVFFLQQILLAPHSDDYRILGLDRGATQADVRDHKRALLKWLHPDRNSNKWESAFFQHVVKAADSISTQMENAEPGAAQSSKEFQFVKLKSASKRPRNSIPRYVKEKRFRRPMFLREHFISFIKRMGLVIAALVVVIFGLNDLTQPDHSSHVVGLARSMLAWVR
jgi:DnaJ domain